MLREDLTLAISRTCSVFTEVPSLSSCRSGTSVSSVPPYRAHWKGLLYPAVLKVPNVWPATWLKCVLTYANVTGNPEKAEVLPEVMDDEVAELAASAPTASTKPHAKVGHQAAGGNVPLDAPPNTKGVALNEAAEASKAIHCEDNGTEEGK
ncbi:hypothetical protein HPB48_006774 [Haemaphysalis longicornis]|uniref:Uncharacterized protein n=1 Tax=Haemaphysalis longicornis TaxID=44386 RepID=A0A9J6FQC2_HAELO|nr:hypothetical protein HPB48_006774 [Haemaphysalis longicornis]